MLLLVRRRDAVALRLDPDLQEVGNALLLVVVFAVAHARSRAHALHVAGNDGRAVADRVLVPQRALEHVSDDLHVAVAMGAEPGARLHAVFVDYPQWAVAHVRGVLVV